MAKLVFNAPAFVNGFLWLFLGIRAVKNDGKYFFVDRAGYIHLAAYASDTNHEGVEEK